MPARGITLGPATGAGKLADGQLWLGKTANRMNAGERQSTAPQRRELLCSERAGQVERALAANTCGSQLIGHWLNLIIRCGNQPDIGRGQWCQIVCRCTGANKFDRLPSMLQVAAHYRLDF